MQSILKYDNISSEFQGFTSTSNKKLNISKTTMDKVKGIFKDIDMEKDLKNPNTEKDSTFLKFKPDEFQGVMNANNNKKVDVSKKLLDRVKHIFKSLDEEESVSGDIISAPSEFQGFTTASYEKVDVSKTAFVKDVNMEKDFKNPNTVKDSTYFNSKSPYKFQGLITASNKKVDMPKTSLDKVKGIFKDINLDVDLEDDSDDMIPLNALKNSPKNYLSNSADHSFSKTRRSEWRKTFICKLCDRAFIYVNCLKKHLKNHVSQELFVSIDMKSKSEILRLHQKTIGMDPENISDDYVIKLIIEDIKLGKFDLYIDEVNTDKGHQMVKMTEVVDSSGNPSTVKSSICTLKSDVKKGPRKARKNKLLKCSVCERMFSRSNSLISHMSTHDYKYPDKCEICNKVFPNKDMLAKHHKTMCASTEQPYHCSTCDMKFTDESSFNDHMIKRHQDDLVTANFIRFEDIIAKNLKQYVPNISCSTSINNITDEIKMYECGSCNARFTDRESFDEHAEELHKNLDVRCIKIEKIDVEYEMNNDDEDDDNTNEDTEMKADILDLPMADVNQMYRMPSKLKKIKKPKYYKCSLCQCLFSRTNHLMRHMSTHNYEYPDKCHICLNVFPNKEMLEKHRMYRCKNTSNLFRCTTCSLDFKSNDVFTEHIIEKHKDEAIAMNLTDPSGGKIDEYMDCEHCDKRFYKKDHLESHMKIHMTKQKKYQCNRCTRRYFQEESLKKHLVVHEFKKGLDSKFPCPYCQKSLTSASNYVIHLRRHTGEKPYKCDMCNKAFSRSSDLQCHRRTHTGEKPYLCTVCRKRFSCSSKLSRHIRIHTGQRPYKCHHCEKTFTQSYDLTIHIRRHTGERPYVCDVCGESFINGIGLHNHKRNKKHE